jgi:predicted AAA+ superfamily ATPase
MASPTRLAAHLFPRNAITQIKNYIEDEHIILIVGSRQTGKTSLLHLIVDELLQQKVSEEQIFYVNLEDFALLEICNRSVQEFVNYLKGSGADFENRNYVLIDEIQYLENPTNFLKHIFDSFPGLKLFVTGSSTLEIRRKFKDSLAGRKVVIELGPLDFTEFLVFQGEGKLAHLIRDFSLRKTVADTFREDFPLRPFQKKLDAYYSQFVLFGGYPRIVLEKSIEKKITFLDELVQAYVRKDIKDLMRIDNVFAFNNLLKAVALQIGNLVNYTELSSSLQMARETVERYLFLLENTFIIKRLTPFFTNRRKEVIKMPKIFFCDTGLRNALLKHFQDLPLRPDTGALVENAVFSNLYKNSPILEEILFWRTQSQNEVDFVLRQADSLLPIEVKFSLFKKLSLPAGLRSFVNNYSCKQAVVLTKDTFEIKRDSAIDIIFLPVWLA